MSNTGVSVFFIAAVIVVIMMSNTEWWTVLLIPLALMGVFTVSYLASFGWNSAKMEAEQRAMKQIADAAKEFHVFMTSDKG